MYNIVMRKKSKIWYCGGRVWSTFVVQCIYGVQCVVVGVTCGARSHIALRLQCTYVWREACIYREWCAIAHGQSV